MTVAMDTVGAFERHRTSVYRWAYRVLGNHHDALDVTQDVFVTWWRVHRENDAPVNAVGWLRTVTINRAINLFKARAKTESVQIEPVANRPTDSGIDRELVAGAIAGLPEMQRAVLFAKIYDGCTFAEMAEQMGLAVSSVKTHYVRGLQAVRRSLAVAGVLKFEVGK